MRLNRRDTSRRVIKRRVTRTLYIIQRGARSVIAHRCFCAPPRFRATISPPSRSRACFIQLPLENCLNVAHATIFHEFQEGRGQKFKGRRFAGRRREKFLACTFSKVGGKRQSLRVEEATASIRNNIFDCFEPYPVTCSCFYADLPMGSRLFLVFAAYWPSFQTGVSYRGRLRVYSEFHRRFAK